MQAASKVSTPPPGRHVAHRNTATSDDPIASEIADRSSPAVDKTTVDRLTDVQRPLCLSQLLSTKAAARAIPAFPTSTMYDLVIYNGQFASSSTVSTTSTWLGIVGEKIVTVSSGEVPLDQCRKSIDAKGAYVTPGGIDSHVHLQQLQIPVEDDTGDTFHSGTRSAVAGGTTTIIAFANQQRHDESLLPLVEQYHRRASEKATFCDYAFHMILTNPTPRILDEELPLLVEKDGITSIKVSRNAVVR